MADDRYDMRMPLPGNALDIFPGQWSGELPTFNKGVLSKFYEDHRILFFEKHICGFSGKKILELGPLEASHTYMMSVRGASDILAVEANRTSYLKCLIVKELLSINARFLLGDFCLLLRDNPPRVDAIIASGVLYHMIDPLGLIEGMARASNTICIWTHYFDPDIIRARPELSKKFSRKTKNVSFYGREIVMCEQSYLEAVEWGGFCGGAESRSYWLTRKGLFAAFGALGYEIVVGDEALDHPNGPCLTFVARRKVSVGF